MKNRKPFSHRTTSWATLVTRSLILLPEKVLRIDIVKILVSGKKKRSRKCKNQSKETEASCDPAVNLLNVVLAPLSFRKEGRSQLLDRFQGGTSVRKKSFKMKWEFDTLSIVFQLVFQIFFDFSWQPVEMNEVFLRSCYSSLRNVHLAALPPSTQKSLQPITIQLAVWNLPDNKRPLFAMRGQLQQPIKLQRNVDAS